MRIPVLSVVIALLLAPQAIAQADKPLDCSTGPITKVFGGTNWLVRSCDGIALHVLSDSGNPAFPFYFLIYPSEAEKGRFVIEGKGLVTNRHQPPHWPTSDFCPRRISPV